jgi:carbon storage regulator
MLVLSRKLGEKILIEGGIELVVVRIGNGNVRLGIVAPRELQIIRQELSFDDDQSSRPEIDRTESEANDH